MTHNFNLKALAITYNGMTLEHKAHYIAAGIIKTNAKPGSATYKKIYDRAYKALVHTEHFVKSWGLAEYHALLLERGLLGNPPKPTLDEVLNYQDVKILPGSEKAADPKQLGLKFNLKASARLDRIAAIIEQVDIRCLHADGPINTGDKGQRYEVRYIRTDGEDMVMGWTDDCATANKMADTFLKAPYVKSTHIIDRESSE